MSDTTQTLLLINTIAIALAAVALLLQCFFAAGTYKAARALQDKVSELSPKAQTLMQSAEQTLTESRKQITDVSAKATEAIKKANEVLDATRTQVGRVEVLLTDAQDRAKLQLDRVEMVLDDTLGKVQSTVTSVHTGVVKPIREIQGIAAGVRAALGSLARGSRPSVAQVTQDEEMFI